MGVVRASKNGISCAGGKIESSQPFAIMTAVPLALSAATSVIGELTASCARSRSTAAAGSAFNCCSNAAAYALGCPFASTVRSNEPSVRALSVPFWTNDAARSVQALSATTALIRGSRSAASSETPAP